MLDRRIVAYDIETIPDPDMGRRIMGQEGSDEDVVHEMVRLRLEETDGKSEYPQQPYHRIVCICAASLDPDTGKFELAAIGGDAMDERSHLEGFVNLLRTGPKAPRLVSWNGNGYDIPVIRYRALLHGVPLPDLYERTDHGKGGLYLNRYDDSHVDVMDVFTNYGASYRVGLGTTSDLLGLPSKNFLTKPIYDHILDGDEAIVREYCKLDVVNTLLVYLAHLHQRAVLDEERLREHVRAVQEKLREETHRNWQDIAQGLEGWPRWPAPDSFATAARQNTSQ